MTELYWISKTVVVDWPLTLLDGTPAPTATVAATVVKPDATVVGATATWVAASSVWRVTYDPTMAGTHVARLDATGTVDSHEEVRFYVKPSLLGSLAPTFSTTTDIGMVRLLISDVDEDNLLFTDAQISGFLTLEVAVKLAAAAALDVVARSEALVSKVIRTQDLSTDGAKLSAELRAHATELRRQYNEIDGDDGGFTIVDFNANAGEEAAFRAGY